MWLVLFVITALNMLKGFEKLYKLLNLEEVKDEDIFENLILLHFEELEKMNATQVSASLYQLKTIK